MDSSILPKDESSMEIVDLVSDENEVSIMNIEIRRLVY